MTHSSQLFNQLFNNKIVAKLHINKQVRNIKHMLKNKIIFGRMAISMNLFQSHISQVTHLKN